MLSAKDHRMAKLATYAIVAEFKDGAAHSGSGFCLSNDGRLITCSHVVSRKTDAQVELAKGILARRFDGIRTVTYEAQIVKNGNPNGSILPQDLIDTNNIDLALLKIELEGLHLRIRFAEDPLSEQDSCLSVGAVEDEQANVQHTVAEGGVTGLWLKADDVTLLVRHDCPSIPGFSGGPLIDSSGRVIGVNTLAPPGKRSRYAIAAGIAQEFVPDLD